MEKKKKIVVGLSKILKKNSFQNQGKVQKSLPNKQKKKKERIHCLETVPD